MEIGTLHWHDNVEVYLKLVGDAFFDGEEVGFVTGVPTVKFGEREYGGYYDEEDGGVATGGGATSVSGLCLRCMGIGVSWDMIERAHGTRRERSMFFETIE